MRFGRVRSGPSSLWVCWQDESVVALSGPPWAEQTHAVRPIADGFEILAPVVPSKIICVARNYRAHAAELGHEVPETAPLIFLKPPSALVATERPIVRPASVGRVDFEGELAVVIGERLKDVDEKAAMDGVFGYTVLNDVTARALQKTLGHFSQAKGYDSFCPVGPWIETDVDPRDLRITTRVDQKTVQDGRTSQMVHRLPQLIVDLSKIFTLEPGDVVATGTPAGVGPLQDGQVVEVEIEGVGLLRNPVRNAA